MSNASFRARRKKPPEGGFADTGVVLNVSPYAKVVLSANRFACGLPKKAGEVVLLFFLHAAFGEFTPGTRIRKLEKRLGVELHA